LTQAIFGFIHRGTTLAEYGHLVQNKKTPQSYFPKTLPDSISSRDPDNLAQD
jgi:hypothetical protein